MTRKNGIILLTVITALIHLGLGLANLAEGGLLFVLNGLGYLALLAGLYFVPQLAPQRALVRYALMAYAAVTIVAYFVVNPDPLGSPVGLGDKAIEVALVVLLWLDRG